MDWLDIKRIGKCVFDWIIEDISAKKPKTTKSPHSSSVDVPSIAVVWRGVRVHLQYTGPLSWVQGTGPPLWIQSAVSLSWVQDTGPPWWIQQDTGSLSWVEVVGISNYCLLPLVGSGEQSEVDIEKVSGYFTFVVLGKSHGYAYYILT